MNEVLDDLNPASAQYQANTRLLLNKLMAKKLLPLVVHAKSIGISNNSLSKFLRGVKVANLVVFKIDNYIEDNK